MVTVVVRHHPDMIQCIMVLVQEAHQDPMIIMEEGVTIDMVQQGVDTTTESAIDMVLGLVPDLTILLHLVLTGGIVENEVEVCNMV
jgi:hypothetical protein